MSSKKYLKLSDGYILNPVIDELDFFFSSFFNSPYPSLYRKELNWKPPTDFYETEKNFVIVMELAQVKHEEVSITYQEGVLFIRGLRKATPPAERRKYHKMEINYGPFEQKITIPGDIDLDSMSAHYEDGFLEICLPKKEISSMGVVDIKVE